MPQIDHSTEVNTYIHDAMTSEDDWTGWAERGNADLALARLARLVLRNKHAEARHYVIEQIAQAAEDHATALEDNYG